MRMVLHRAPVVVRHPIVEDSWITLSRGMEFEDDDPIVAAFGWAFEPDDTPKSVESVEIAPQKRARKA